MTHRIFSPAVDIYSTPTSYKLFLTIPDIQASIVGILYDPNSRLISISGTMVRPAEFAGMTPQELDNSLLHEERPMGEFERTVKIPGTDEIDVRGIKNSFDKGSLIVVLPKGPTADPL